MEKSGEKKTMREKLKKKRKINEEYKRWQKNSERWYELVISETLEWPSLTVEWLPSRDKLSGQDYPVQKLILGTQTTDDKPNYLMIANVLLPPQDSDSDSGHSNNASSSDYASITPKLKNIRRIAHEGDVNRARYMPHNPFLIATKTESGEVHIFNQRKYLAYPPELRLRGHTSEGFGLSWSKLKQGYLLSGADNCQICLWDVNATTKRKALDTKQTFKGHKSAVEDVAWHMKYDYLFGSAGADHKLLMWDIRTPSIRNPALSVVAHKAEVNCLAFNPIKEWCLATGSADSEIKLFDLRKFTSPIHIFTSHKKEVSQICWSPEKWSILASSSFDRSLIIWDLNRIDLVQTPEEAEEGPSEQLFVHKGHKSKICDFSWNPYGDWIIASVAHDNIIQIWKIGDHMYK